MLVAVCVAGALLPLALRLQQIRDGPIASLARDRAAVLAEVTVTSDPRPIASGPGGAGRVIVDARLERVRSVSRRWRVGVPVAVLAGPNWSRVMPGQRLRADVRLAPPLPGAMSAALVMARDPPELIGAAPWWQRSAARIRAGLVRASRGLPEPERGLLPGLVDGDTSGLDPVLAAQFKQAGLTHLVAVSGTNAAILIGVVLLVLRRLGARRSVCITLGALTLIGFVAVARPSPSVLRAAVMAAVMLLALATGRPRDGLPALSASVLVLLMWHPEWAVDPGFAMSVLATGALLLLAPAWVEALRRRHIPGGLAEGIGVAAAASVVTAPVIVVLSGRLSLVSVPANVLAEVAVAPATVLGVLAAALAPWWPSGAAGMAQLAGLPCRWLTGVAEFFAGLPGGSIGWPATLTGAISLVVLIVVVVALARVPLIRAGLVAAAVVAVIVQIPFRAEVGGWPVRGLVLTACDIGQGDGLVLPVGPHAGIVVDVGPNPVLMDRCLRDLHVTSVPLLVLSHFDLDHVGGVAGVLRGRQVGRVVTGSLALQSPGRRLVERVLAAAGQTVAVAPAGRDISIGGVRLEVLAPPVGYVPPTGDSNDSSLVIRATVSGHTILLTGDAAPLSQQDMLRRHVDVRAEVLKVPHHGSRFFEPAFLAAVQARVAVISVGAHNTYGHPAPSLMSALDHLGVPMLRTDRSGAIEITATGAALGAAAQAHGPRSAPAHGLRSAPAHGPRDAPPAATHATMSAWLEGAPGWPDGGTSEICLAPASSWSSATRSCSSPVPSSRSPPRRGAGIRPRRSPSGPAATSWRETSPRSSARHCSAVRACSSSGPPRTCRRPRSPPWRPCSPRRPTTY